MPDDEDGSQLSSEFTIAQSAIIERFEQLGIQQRNLNDDEIALYRQNRMKAGWRIPIQFSDAVRQIDVILPPGFPWWPPRVALVDRPPFLTWPHVEIDGVLCSSPAAMECDPEDPVGVLWNVLNDAIKLVEDLSAGRLNTDFQDEFLSYWDWAAEKSGPMIVSLLNVSGPSRIVRIWRGINTYVLGETDNDLRSWLANRYSKKPSEFSSSSAGFFALNAPPIPENYPQSGQKLNTFITQASPQNEELMQRLVSESSREVITALAYKTSNGPALAGAIVRSKAAPKFGNRNPQTKGFRPGRVPEKIQTHRFLGGSTVVRRSIDRADAPWVHGRGEDPRALRLMNRTAAIVGCGSVGGPVAVSLAQAGLGRLILIDPDTLKWANIGRHPLGASSVGHMKSKKLAEKLLTDFPHMQIEHFSTDIDAIITHHGDVLTECDLIVCATGSWSADSRVEAWRNSASPETPLMYCWVEAHASAGHVLLLDNSEGCLRCGFGKDGFPKFHVTVWPGGEQTKREPACGAVFQPYGPVELGFINNLAAEMALESLLGEIRGPAHRIWVAPQRRLHSLCGDWADWWRASQFFRNEGGYVADLRWPFAECQRCTQARAA